MSQSINYSVIQWVTSVNHQILEKSLNRLAKSTGVVCRSPRTNQRNASFTENHASGLFCNVGHVSAAALIGAGP